MTKSDEQIERESANRQKRAAKAALPPVNHSKNGVADWNNADCQLVLALVCIVSSNGGAVRYGYTRDGGAYSIGMYLEDDSKTYYCNEKDGINETLSELIEYFGK
jgi:hypothetical protein